MSDYPQLKLYQVKLSKDGKLFYQAVMRAATEEDAVDLVRRSVPPWYKIDPRELDAEVNEEK